MTALTVTRDAGTSSTRQPMLLGLRNLVRKDAQELLRSKRAWVVLVVTLLVYLPSAANSRINEWVLSVTPEAGGQAAAAQLSFVPMDNLLAAVSTQFIVLAVIFATMSLLLGEKEAGTLAWTVSKPVARTSILVSKWATSTLILWAAVVAVPIAILTGFVTLLYGAPDLGSIAVLTVALIAVPALFVAIALAASTVVPNQAAVAAVGLGLFALPQVVSTILPGVADLLPTSMFGWAIQLSTTGSAPLVTPVAWLLALGALFLVARNRLDAMEL